MLTGIIEDEVLDFPVDWKKGIETIVAASHISPLELDYDSLEEQGFFNPKSSGSNENFTIEFTGDPKIFETNWESENSPGSLASVDLTGVNKGRLILNNEDLVEPPHDFIRYLRGNVDCKNKAINHINFKAANIIKKNILTILKKRDDELTLDEQIFKQHFKSLNT